MPGRIVAIITARQGSKRLPNKALADICGKPMLQRIVDRVRLSDVDETVVATSINSPDIIQYCKEHDIPYYAGSETDLLERLTETARKFEATTIVYIWGDSPLINPSAINSALDIYSKDYLTVGTINGVIAVFNSAVLFSMLNIIPKGSRDREYIHEFMSKPLTVDTQEDLEEVRRIYGC